MIAGVHAWLSSKQEELLPPGSLRARFTVGTLWAVAGAIISRGFTLLASIVCARLLGETQFGELGMIQSTVGVFGVFAGLGLGLTATKYVAEFRDRDREKVGRILALASLVAFLSSVLMTFLLFLAAHRLAIGTLVAPGLEIPLMMGTGLVFFSALNGAQTGALAGFEAYRTIALVNIWTGVFSFPLIVAGVWRWGLRGAVCGMVGALSLNWLLNNFAIRRECRRTGIRYDFSHCFQELNVLHRFSFPAFLSSLVVGPALWVCNTLLIRQPEGYSQLGIYAAADRWRLLLLFVPTSVFGMVVPVLSNLYGSGNYAGFDQVFRLNLRLNLWLALAPAVVISALALPIMSLYGVQFRAGWPILILLAGAALPEALNNIYMARLICAHRIWWRVALDLELIVILLLLAWRWVPRWGALGLAMAYLTALVTLWLSQALLARLRLLPSDRELTVASNSSRQASVHSSAD